MAQTIKLKRSATQGAVPNTSQLELGEIALNTYDGKLYIKKDDGTESIVDVTSGGAASTDELPEGIVNFYYTDERVDDRVNDLIQAGLGVTTSYDDVNGELLIESDTIEELCKNATASTILKGTPFIRLALQAISWRLPLLMRQMQQKCPPLVFWQKT